MATTVESPGIVSAKEEAAAILFAREPQKPSVMTAPAPEQSLQAHEKPSRPSFARYHEPEVIHARPRAVDTSALRPYETYEEVAVESEPQVVRPYIDSSDYLSSAVAPTTVAVQTPVTTVAETPKSVAVVETSPLDIIEEDTEYVVKFKKSTIAAVSIMASIFVLMAVLMIVNIVSLVTTSAEISALAQESTTLQQRLAQDQTDLQGKQATNNLGGASHAQYVAHMEETTATEAGNAQVDSSFFDWLCHSFSRLFN